MDHDDKNHQNHLCQVSAKGVDGDYTVLVKGAKFVCENCGRSAVSAKNLCAPKPIE